MTERKGFLQKLNSNLVALAAVMFTFFTLMGVNSSLHALETRVRVLDESVQKLNQVEAQIMILQEDVKEIGEFRNDILEAIEAAIVRDDHPRRVGRDR